MHVTQHADHAPIIDITIHRDGNDSTLKAFHLFKQMLDEYDVCAKGMPEWRRRQYERNEHYRDEILR